MSNQVNGSTSLMRACQHGNLTDIQRIIKQYPKEIRKQDKHGNNCFHYAAFAEQIHVMEYLLQPKDSHYTSNNNEVELSDNFVDTKNESGRTALLIVAEKGNLKMVKFLIERGANLNKTAYNGYTALHCSAWKNRIDVVKYFIELKVDVNAQTLEGVTPLFIASENGHLETIKILLSNGANVNLCNQKKASPLQIAIYQNHMAVVEYLVECGAKINHQKDDGKTGVYIAVEKMYIDMVSYLLDKGAMVNVCDNNRDTPLHIAVRKSNDQIVQHIMFYRPELFPNLSGETPMDIARNTTNREICELFEMYNSMGKEETRKRIEKSLLASYKILENINNSHPTITPETCETNKLVFDRRIDYIVPDILMDDVAGKTQQFVMYNFSSPSQSQHDNHGSSICESFISLSDISMDIKPMEKTLAKHTEELQLLIDATQVKSCTSEAQVTQPIVQHVKHQEQHHIQESIHMNGFHISRESTTQTVSEILIKTHEGSNTELSLDLRESRENEIALPSRDLYNQWDVNHHEHILQRFENLELRQIQTEHKLLELTRTTARPNYNENSNTGTLHQVENMVSDAKLMKIANMLALDWKELGLLLELKKTDLDFIEMNYQGRIKHGIWTMLIDWRNSTYGNHVQILQRKLKDINRRDILPILINDN